MMRWGGQSCVKGGVRLNVIAHVVSQPAGLENARGTFQRAPVHVEQREAHTPGAELRGQRRGQSGERAAPGVEDFDSLAGEAPAHLRQRGAGAPQEFRCPDEIEGTVGGVHRRDGLPAREKAIRRIGARIRTGVHPGNLREHRVQPYDRLPQPSGIVGDK